MVTLFGIQQYFRQCPSVVCPPVSEECETVEFLVYAFEYRLPGTSDERRGTTVSVRCESCAYCLDRPPRSPRRTSRSRARSRSRSSHRRRRSVITKTPLGHQVGLPLIACYRWWQADSQTSWCSAASMVQSSRVWWLILVFWLSDLDLPLISDLSTINV